MQKTVNNTNFFQLLHSEQQKNKNMDTTKSTLVLPEEIVGMVLKNFIMERPQLLNARLISRSWNKEALIQLKNSKFQMTLSSTKIKKFIKFAKRSRNLKQQFVLPIALTFHVHERETDETKIRLELERMNSLLKSLLKIFEPDCIHTLSLRVSSTTVEQMSQVIKILAMVSPTIETVGLSSSSPFRFGGNINVGAVNTLFTNHDFIFPKLKKLDLSSLELFGIGDTRRPTQLAFCSHLIGKASAALMELSLPSSFQINEVEISTEMLKQINYISVQDFLFVDLVGNHLLAPSLPSLTKLQVRATKFHPNESQSQRFLECLFTVSNSLEYLSVEFIGENRLNLTPFPEFQSLKHLQIKSCWNKTPEFVNAMVFPVLTSIDMYLNIFGVIEKPNEFDGGVTGQMPNVMEVTLRFTRHGQEDNFDYSLIPVSIPMRMNPHPFPFHKYFDYLTAKFPSAHKLIIINEIFEEYYFKSFFRGLKGFDGAKNFHQLEFVDFDENYLGQIFEETLHPPRIILENIPRNPELENVISLIFQNLVVSARIETEENRRTIIQPLPNQDAPNQLINLKSLTLRLDWKGKSKCSHGRIKRLSIHMRCTKEDRKKLLEGFPNSLNLLSLARNLPKLEEINISSIMLGSYDKEIQVKEIKSVNEEYPGLKIITI